MKKCALGWLMAVGAATIGSGCSSSSSAPGASSDAGATGEAAPVQTAQPVDAGSVPDASGTCPVATAIDATTFPYKPANVVPGSCTTGELAALVDFLNKVVAGGGQVSVNKMAATVSTKCSACVFSDGTGAKWAPLLTKNDQIDAIDRGACMEVLSGNVECGRAYQQSAQCMIAACASCSADARASCMTNAKGVAVACGGSIRALHDACGANTASYEDTCLAGTWDFEGGVRALCIGAP